MTPDHPRTREEDDCRFLAAAIRIIGRDVRRYGTGCESMLHQEVIQDGPSATRIIRLARQARQECDAAEAGDANG